MPFSPAFFLLPLFQLQDAADRGISLTAFPFCLHCFSLLPSFIPGVLPAFSTLFPLLVVSVYQASPHHFLVYSLLWKGGTGGWQGVCSEQSSCEAANPALICWVPDGASGGAAWTGQQEDLIILPLALVLPWGALIAINEQLGPRGKRIQEGQPSVWLDTLGQSENSSVSAGYTTVLVHSFLCFLYFQAGQGRSW